MQDFYFRWCEGEYIDEVFPEEILDKTQYRINLPQEKMRQLRNAQPELGDKITWGVRQVDIYTGLNVMILLLELQRYGKRHDLHLSFHLCGEVDEKGKPKDENKLSRIISYSDGCLRDSSFFNIVGAFLSGANLNNAYLKNANLQNAHLDNAHLDNAYLDNAHLDNAHLDNAHLDNAYLDNAHLDNAYLKNANLKNANLKNANLKNANLQNAHLDKANLQGIKWNEDTTWGGVIGLETARNVPEELKR